MTMAMHRHQVRRLGNFLGLTTTHHPVQRANSFTTPYQVVRFSCHNYHPQARRVQLRRAHPRHGRTQFTRHRLPLLVRPRRTSPVSPPLILGFIVAPSPKHSECPRLTRRALLQLALQAAPITWRRTVLKARYRMNRSKKA
jgi:hypothetical protein